MDQFLSLQNQQQHEQITAAIRQMAQVLHEYFAKLREEGFSARQAFTMTVQMQNQMIANAYRQQQEGA